MRRAVPLFLLLLLGCTGTPDTIAAPTSPPRTASVLRAETNGTASPQDVARAQAGEPSPSPAVVATPTPEQSEYDSNLAMDNVFPGFSITTAEMYETLDEVEAHRDRSLVPVLVEILQFMPGRNSRERVTDTLRSLTGQGFEGHQWGAWMEWLGQNLEEYQPPSEYPDWKSRFYAQLDPRFAVFLRPGREFSRIDLTEIVWGGVRPDGIPDLRSPPFLEPADAEFMLPDDRVFGLEINGETKAYPLRIVNAHEMVNDTVGGEPISLMW